MRKNCKDVISCDFYPAAGKGSNFSSIIHRIVIKYVDNESRIQQTKLIVKILPLGDRGKFMEKHNIFNREIYVYEKILPQISAQLMQIGCTTKIAPTCIAVLTEPCALVLEDLCNSNYKMLNRREGLNLEQTMHVLTNIAKFHAASVKIYEINPKLMENLFKNSISECINSFCIFYSLGMVCLRQLVEKWAGFEEIAKKLQILQDKIVEKVFENFGRKCTFNVLNHNDLWTNNVMFKYNAQEQLINSAIIDFQFVYWGSPAFDLNFFLYTSVEDCVRKANWNFFVHHYHRILIRTLKKLKTSSKLPIVTDIHEDITQNGIHAIVACLLKAAVVVAPPDFIDIGLILSDTNEGSSYRQQLFSNPKYIEFIKPLLLEFNTLGYLD
uniref:Putative ecdysteroid kinase n=1 Tax=Nyssomyia neivai TaxID=330878 RepID=A0A1L8DYK7_9DIPT